MHHLHPYLYYQSAHAPASSVKLKRDHAECIFGKKRKRVGVWGWGGWTRRFVSKYSQRNIQKQRKYHRFIYVSFDFTDKSTRLSPSYFQNSHLFRGYARFIERTQKGMGENGDEEEQKKKNCFREELYTCALKASFQKLPS